MHGTHSSPRSLVLARTSLIASVVIAGAIQIALAVRSPVVARDGIAFIRTAQALVRDPLRTIRETDQHPGYPVMIVLGRTVAAAFTEDDRVHAWEAGALLMSGLCGLLSVVVIWLLARRLFDERTAGVAALLFAILPLFRQNASDALSDTPHLLFFLLATYLVVEGFHRRQAGWFALAGLTSGAAYLIRPEGLLVALVGGAALVLAVFSGRMRRGTVVAGLLGLILAAGAAAGPYVLVKGSLTSKKDFTKLARSHKWIPKSRSGAGHFEPSSHATPVKGSRPSPSPVRVLSSGLAEVFQEYAHGLRYVLLLPVMAGFLMHRRLGGDRTSGRFVAALAAGHAVLLLTLYANSKYVSHRHVIPLAALSMSWAAAGVVFLSDRMSLLLGRRHNASARPRYGWVLCVITGVLVLGLLPRRPSGSERIDCRTIRSSPTQSTFPSTPTRPAG